MIATLLIGATRFLVGGHAHWVGCAPSPAPRLYFANHGSHLDTLLIWAALPPVLRPTTHPVAAADYWGGGGLKATMRRALNLVLLERAAASRGADPLAPLRDKLEAGHSLIIFPEGTRGEGRLPGPFKAGLHRLATQFPAVELIPVYLENPARAFPKGAFLPAPIACAVRFGTPIALASGEERAAFLERARAAVVELAT